MRSRENVANAREVKSVFVWVAPMYFPQVLAIAPKILNTGIVFFMPAFGFRDPLITLSCQI